MSSRPPTTPVPIRLDEQLRARIERAAKKLGLNSTAVIRFAIHNQLPLIESGVLTLNDPEKSDPEAA
jgi:hypothetical protein